MMRRMRTSNLGLKLLMNFEGFRPNATALDDSRWVIGYGHTKGARKGVRVTRAEAVAILRDYDLPPIEQLIDDNVMAPLNQNEFDALVSLVFNIGGEAFKTSDVLAFINSGEKLSAGEAMTAWRKARLNGRLILVDALIRRRAAEKALFLRHPEGSPISPSVFIRPELDEKAARFIPSETPVVATRERKRPVDTETVEPVDVADEQSNELETAGVHDLPDTGTHYVVPDDEIGTDAVAQPSDKTAPELAAGALVARLTRILGEPSDDTHASPLSADEASIEDGPTPDEITKAISELADGPSPLDDDDLAPLPDTASFEDHADNDVDEPVVTADRPKLIDDLEPLSSEALGDPMSFVGANMVNPLPKKTGVGLSWLIYVLLGLIGGLFLGFGIIGPSLDVASANEGTGNFGYTGMTVLGGLLLLLALYFLFKAFRNGRKA